MRRQDEDGPSLPLTLEAWINSLAAVTATVFEVLFIFLRLPDWLQDRFATHVAHFGGLGELDAREVPFAPDHFAGVRGPEVVEAEENVLGELFG